MTWANFGLSILFVAFLAICAHRLGITTRTRIGPTPGIVAGILTEIAALELFYFHNRDEWWQVGVWLFVTAGTQAITGAMLYKLEAGKHTPDITDMLADYLMSRRQTSHSQHSQTSHSESPFMDEAE